MKKLISYTLLLSLISVMRINSQPPSDWTINPSAYNHSMVITCVLNINSAESRNTKDVIAAFIGSDVRGVSSPITYLKSQDRYVATLIIYSNDENVPITFKVYDQANNFVSSSPTAPINFVVDKLIGTLEDPFIFSDGSLPKKLNFNNLITPNGDGRNDFLVIDKLILFDKYTLSIYDIRGLKVYETTNYQNNWNGSNVQSGEYYIQISGIANDKRAFNYNDVLHLVKIQN